MKEKFRHNNTTVHKGPERGWRYSSALSLTLALDGTGGSKHHSLLTLMTLNTVEKYEF